MKAKHSLLMIIDILSEYTDVEHILSCNELIRLIDGEYGYYWIEE